MAREQATLWLENKVWKQVGLGLGTFAVAGAASVFCGEVVGSMKPGYPLFLVSVLAAAWFGEVPGGIAATVAASLGYWLYLVPPKLTIGLSELQSFDLLSFVLAALMIVGFSWWRREKEHDQRRLTLELKAASETTTELLAESRMERQRTSDLNRELEEALGFKDQFLGFISHELKTPLTTIYGGLHELDRRVADGSEERELVELMLTDAERLRRMIEDLLTLARLGAGQAVPLEPVLLQRTIRRVVEQFTRRTKRKAPVIVLAPDGAPAAAGKEAYVERILENLLSNADKYSPPDYHIVVQLTVTEAEDIVTVIDDGPGVAPSELGLIFEQFFRSGRTTGLAGGSGLGLTVCRTLVSSMGGRIWAECPPDKGLSVSFALGTVADEGEEMQAIGPSAIARGSEGRA